MPVTCLGLAFKTNIDDFRESPARFVAGNLPAIRQSDPHHRALRPQLPIEFTDTGTTLIDIDAAIETCGVMIVLIDHDLFRVVPAEERDGVVVYDTRGIWPVAGVVERMPELRLAS